MTLLKVATLTALQAALAGLGLWLVVRVLRHYWWPILPDIPYRVAYLVALIAVLAGLATRMFGDQAKGLIE